MTDRDDTSRLSEEQTLLRMLFDAMPQLGWTARADGWIDYYNRGWYEYTGTTLPEMEGWGWTKVHDPNELSRVMDSWKQSIATGKPWEVEFPLRRHDGVYRWFLSRATPIYNVGGSLVRWVGISTDIDDQKRAQRVVTHLQLAKLREAVERERRVLELFVEHAPAELAMFDREMRYLAASRRWYTTFHTPDDLIGRCHYDLFPELPAAWREAHRRTLAGETMSSSEDRFDRADGAVLWVSWETRPWYERDGTIGGIMIASEDITASVQTRRALEDARREAERANRAKDEFMAMLGHELRNPLAPILTAVQLMRLRGPEGNAGKLDVVERQVKHMLRLVDDLLDVSRIARGKVALSREPVESASVVAKAIEMAEPLVDANRHHLTVEVPRSGLEIDVDPARMAQVVSNLLTNAAKYTPSQGRIVVRARRESDDVVLEVQDNGIGIAPQLLPRVFDLFAQGRQGIERAQGGLGLGLAIVQSLVKLHGGSVSAASAGPDRGSTFTIRLPALRARGEAAIACSRPADQGPRRAHDASMRVLVVDDNQDAAQLTAEAVSAAGYQSDLAYDGLEALEHAQRSHPDIVLLDLGLPVLDGYEVARRLRETTGVSCPNLVAITGYGQETDFRRTKDAGFDAHIVKPVNLDRLLAVLEEQCQRRRADRTRKT